MLFNDKTVKYDLIILYYTITIIISFIVCVSRGCSRRFFGVFFGIGSHFRAQSQEDSVTDVIGYKR